MQDKLTPLELILSCFAVSSLGGLAQYLRRKPDTAKIPLSMLIGTLLHSGMIGVAICFCWLNYFDGKESPWFALLVSSLAGLGGATLLEFVAQALSRGGVKIVITPKDED